MLKKISKLSTSILLAVFFILATYGVNLSLNAHSNSEMTNCPLMGEMTQVCQMDVMEHIMGWQKLFAAAFQSNALQFLLVSLLALATAFWFLKIKIFRIFSPTRAQQVRESPHTYLLANFYDGILRKRE